LRKTNGKKTLKIEKKTEWKWNSVLLRQGNMKKKNWQMKE